MLHVTGADGDVLDESDLDAKVDDLDSFLEPNFLKLKGMVSLEDVLVCEQNVGAGERTILCVCLIEWVQTARTPWLEHLSLLKA